MLSRLADRLKTAKHGLQEGEKCIPRLNFWGRECWFSCHVGRGLERKTVPGMHESRNLVQSPALAVHDVVWGPHLCCFSQSGSAGSLFSATGTVGGGFMNDPVRVIAFRFVIWLVSAQTEYLRAGPFLFVLGPGSHGCG